MQITWGSINIATYNQLVKRIRRMAKRCNAFDVCATQEDYKRLKATITGGVVGGVIDNHDGWVWFVVAKSKEHLVHHEETR